MTESHGVNDAAGYKHTDHNFRKFTACSISPLTHSFIYSEHCLCVGVVQSEIWQDTFKLAQLIPSPAFCHLTPPAWTEVIDFSSFFFCSLSCFQLLLWFSLTLRLTQAVGLCYLQPLFSLPPSSCYRCLKDDVFFVSVLINLLFWFPRPLRLSRLCPCPFSMFGSITFLMVSRETADRS